MCHGNFSIWIGSRGKSRILAYDYRVFSFFLKETSVLRLELASLQPEMVPAACILN
jgi:hypothetical protein